MRGISKILVNDDDDNGNGNPDYADTGPDPDENDMEFITWDMTGDCSPLPDCSLEGHEYDWRASSPGSSLKVFRFEDKSAPASGQIDTLPFGGYIEGVAPTNECGVPVSLGSYCHANIHACYAYSEPVTVVKIDSLTWEKGDSTNEDLSDCPNNGGIRIFPDWLSPLDETNPPNLRQMVKLVATITPPKAGVRVYFKVFDVDDPFDQLYFCPNGPSVTPDRPCVPQITLIDTNALGSDNRGAEPFALPWTASSETGAGNLPDDKAEVTFTVSMQPGNNYRAAASLFQAAMDQNTTFNGQTVNPQQHADALPSGAWFGYSAPRSWSQMLTVWRKLVLEVDSMDRESESFTQRNAEHFEQDYCVVASVTPNSPSDGLTSLVCGPDPINPQRVGFAGHNFFEGGAFWCVDGGQQWMVVRSAAGPDSYTLTLWGNPGPGIVGQQCYVRDDDRYFGIAPGQLPTTTVIDDNISRAYRDAYIEVEEATPLLNLFNIVSWESHLSPAALSYQHVSSTGVSSRMDLWSDRRFWVRHVVLCYQSDLGSSADGDGSENCAISKNCPTVQAPYSVLGLSALPQLPVGFGLTARTAFSDSAISTIYVEAIRDEQIDNTSARQWQYVAHEIGHQVIILDGTITSGEHHERGLMSGEPETPPLQNLPAYHFLTSPTIKRFREVERW